MHSIDPKFCERSTHANSSQSWPWLFPWPQYQQGDYGQLKAYADLLGVDTTHDLAAPSVSTEQTGDGRTMRVYQMGGSRQNGADL